MVRETSIDAYNSIKDNGLLGPKQWEVYDALFKFGPCTANELFHEVRGSTAIVQANYHARLSEHRDMGTVKECGERECSRTGERAIVWDVTSELPHKLRRRSGKLGKYRALCARLIEHYQKTGRPTAAEWIQKQVDEIEGDL